MLQEQCMFYIILSVRMMCGVQDLYIVRWKDGQFVPNNDIRVSHLTDVCTQVIKIQHSDLCQRFTCYRSVIHCIIIVISELHIYDIMYSYIDITSIIIMISEFQIYDDTRVSHHNGVWYIVL